MKKIREKAPWILMLWPYLFGLVFFLTDDDMTEVFNTFILLYLVLTILIYVLNLWNAFALRGEDGPRRAAFYDMLLKLIHIPFYLGVFMLGVLMLGVMVVPIFVFISPFLIAIMFLVDAFLMLTTSMYGISAAAKAAGRGTISKKSAVWLGIFHCFFVTDVICAVILYVKIRRSLKNDKRE